MAKEYIEREALLKKVFPYEGVDKMKYTINAKMIYEAIKEAPAADVVEVVRCKDCRFRSSPECAWETNNDFCSYGERRTENGN